MIDFGEFFGAVHGYDPFPWQLALADTVADQGWPEAFQVPTGLGKTAVLDVAVWALAGGSSAAGLDRAPRRTYLVVDRRLVVDQAYDRAQRIAGRIEAAESGVLLEVASALRALGSPDPHHGESILEVVRMRGGTTWASRFIRRPDLPALVVGTVDQLGSRALFRGYGVGDRRRPIDAALVGTDALVIVDEVHLSRPFVETMQAIDGYEALAPARAGRPVQLVQMSATIPHAGATFVTRADWEDEVAGPRLKASKMARFVKVEARSAADVMANLAVAHRRALGGDTVAVVVNTVGLARAVFDRLRAKHKTESCLLVGKVRPVDRARLQSKLAPFLMGAAVDGSSPPVLVATQTVEVGVDLDVGALVTQAAPLDSLVQRLGRLDRAGKRERTEVTVVRVAGKDPVYGEPTEATWDVLLELGERSLSVPAGNVALADLRPAGLDLGVEGIDRNLAGVDRLPLVARTAAGPVVLPPIVDVWARTAPVPVPDEPVAPYLHGIERPSAMVSVAWRATCDSVERLAQEQALASSLELVPVRSGELVEVPIWEAVALLQGKDIDSGADVATGEGDLAPDELVVPGMRLADDTPVALRRPSDVRPGDVIVIPTTSGGYDEWGWTGRSGGIVADVADLCRPWGTLRLQQSVLSSLGVEGIDTASLAKATQRLVNGDADEAEAAVTAVLVADAVAEVAVQLERLGWVGLGAYLRGRQATEGCQDGVTVRFESALQDLEVQDGTDLSSSQGAGRVELDVHLQAVADRAEAIAARLGLDEASTAAVRLAALAHDLGKADPRFQLSLWQGDRLAREADGRVLAKSGQRLRHTYDWPLGLRHEALSATLLDDFLDGASVEVDRELVAHLVLSHHGHQRPLMPPRGVGKRTQITVTSPVDGKRLASSGIESQIDWDSPRRFHELCRRYGWWGLALLEAVVRSADTCVSEEGS
ncbi:MAG: type I-G CRISPR-associated helicase/endonuclease Cas3g [Acidimicrobiales bacterium]